MKKSNIILIIQAILMYLIQLPLYIALALSKVGETAGNTIKILLLVGFAALGLMVPVIIVSVVFACLHFAELSASPTKTTLIVKLALIPWYVFNFVVCFLLVVGFLNPWLALAIPILITIEVVTTYVFMLSTSIHSIAYTVKYLTMNKTNFTPQVVVALVFQLFFCFDIVGAIMLEVENKKLMRNE